MSLIKSVWEPVKTDYQSKYANLNTSVHTTRIFSFSIMLFSYTLVFSAIIAAASASNVIDLNPANFDSIVGQGKPALVEL